MSTRGIKHLIECNCVLPQFRKQNKPPYHSFVVFSVVDASDVVEPKTVQCNNCGVVHRVIDFCKSEILTGKEDCSFVSIEDLKFMLPSQVKEILTTYNCDLPTFEEALFIIQNEQWNSFVVLERKDNDGDSEGKILRFKSHTKLMIEPFIDRRTL